MSRIKLCDHCPARQWKVTSPAQAIFRADPGDPHALAGDA